MKELHTIHIRDFRVHPVIGVYADERKAGQEILLNITIKHTRPSLADDLGTTFDYDEVAKKIESYTETEQPFLIETYAHAIADLCLHVSCVEEVAVEVVKPHALKNGIVSTVVQKQK